MNADRIVPSRIVHVGLAAVAAFAMAANEAVAQACQPLVPALQKHVTAEAVLFTENVNRSPTEAMQLLDFAVLYALMDADNQTAILVPAESAQTNKQTGASGRTGGVASLIERPDFATLLALAVESGAVTSGHSDNQLTLSSSLYALGAAIGGDTASTYRNLGHLTRVGLSATFDTQPGDGSLDNARRDQLRQWAVVIRLTPDRGVRSREFERWWIRNVRPLLEAQATALTGIGSKLADVVQYQALRREVRNDWVSKLPAARGSGALAIEQLFSCSLQTRIIEPISAGTLTLPPDVVKDIRTDLLPALVASTSSLAKVDDAVRQHVEEADGKSAASISVRRYRPVDKTDYAEAMFAYSHSLAPMRAAINAGMTYYFMDSSVPGFRKGPRDAVFAAALERSFSSPFLKGTADLSEVTFSIGVRWEHTFENGRTVSAQPEKDVRLFQARLEIPLLMGAILPISFTAANDESLVQEDRTWNKGLYFGLTFDMDKFAALAKALAKR